MGGLRIVISACVLLTAPGIATTVVAAAEPAALRMQMDEQGHLRPKLRERLPAEMIPPRTRFGQSYRVYSFTDPIQKVAKVDYALSRLCQRGGFIQQVDGLYWAQTPDRRLGVAFSGGANLVDGQNRREKATVYFFDGQDAYCTVYVAKQEAVMARFVAPGSRLPVLGPMGIPAPMPAKAAGPASGSAGGANPAAPRSR
jgi:hypothetical protein